MAVIGSVNYMCSTQEIPQIKRMAALLYEGCRIFRQFYLIHVHELQSEEANAEFICLMKMLLFV